MTEPFSAQAALAAASMEVTPANVLQVAAVLLTEADRLDTVLREKMDRAVVGLCGGDPVSREAADAFNERIRDLRNQCQAYNDELRAAGRALQDTARDYGISEEQIAASFRGPAPPDGSISPSRAGR